MPRRATYNEPFSSLDDWNEENGSLYVAPWDWNVYCSKSCERTCTNIQGVAYPTSRHCRLLVRRGMVRTLLHTARSEVLTLHKTDRVWCLWRTDRKTEKKCWRRQKKFLMWVLMLAIDLQIPSIRNIPFLHSGFGEDSMPSVLYVQNDPIN